ncbi:MAG: tRNA epoxyqueuosine(34) reductase QueG [Planctomycetota bacterium]
MRDAAERVLELAGEAGFALAGIASAEPSDRADAVREWVAAGRHGTMAWLANHLDVRLDPGLLLPGARSVIAVCDAYHAEAAGPGTTGGGEASAEADDGRARGRVARYAWGDDYHRLMKKRLHGLADTLAAAYPGATFRTAVDTAPALERELASRAGLGWQGKNTMMIHPRHGSYTLLGLVATTLPLPTSAELDYPAVPGGGRTVDAVDRCANCTRCIDACPTGAIAATGYSLDASRCVSYLTIEHRGVIEDALLPGVGDWLAGCDVCQEVCPYNEVGRRNPLPVRDEYSPMPRGLDRGLDLVELMSWTAEDRAGAFRGSALKRIKLDMLRRNAVVVAGNLLTEREDPALRAAVRRCLEDESGLVRATAEQVVARWAAG